MICDQCGARLSIGAESGDNDAIMRCQLKAGHNGPHRETFSVRFAHEPKAGCANITWHGKKRAKK